MRVRELVFVKRSTSYKEVADELINDLINEGKMTGETKSVYYIICIILQSKEEKNVRRRVYDALNVLISAGIIKKTGKVFNKTKFARRFSMILKRNIKSIKQE